MFLPSGESYRKKEKAYFIEQVARFHVHTKP